MLTGREICRQNFLDWAFQAGEQNTVKAREKHEAIDGLFAGIQLTVREICYQRVLGGTFRFGRKEHGKGEKHDDNLYASSGTSQSNHPRIGVYK